MGYNVKVTADNTTVIGGAGQTKVTISGSGVELATHPHNNTTASFARFNVKSTSYTGIIDMPQDSYKLRVRGPLHLELQGTTTTLYNSSGTGNSLLRLLYSGQPQIYAATGSFRILAGSSTIADGATGGGGGFGFIGMVVTINIFLLQEQQEGDNNNRGVQFHNESSGIYTGSLRIESTAPRDAMVLKSGGVYLGRQGGNPANLNFKATGGSTINMEMGLGGIEITGANGGGRMTPFRFSGDRAAVLQFDTNTQGGDILFEQSTGSLNNNVRGGVIVRRQDSNTSNNGCFL